MGEGSLGLDGRPGVPRSSVRSQLRATRPPFSPSPDVVRGETKGSLSGGWSRVSGRGGRVRGSEEPGPARPLTTLLRFPAYTGGDGSIIKGSRIPAQGSNFPLSQRLDFVTGVPQCALLPGMRPPHPDPSSLGPLGPQHPNCRPRRLLSPGLHRPRLSPWQNSRARFPERRQPPRELLIPSIQL